MAASDKLLVALMCHAGDVRQAQALLRWINRLGKNNYPLLLVVDRDTPFDEVMVCQKLALDGFSDFHITTNAEPTKGWPAGPYSLFKAAAEAVHKRFHQPFLLLEPDAIPLCTGWVEKIDCLYKCGTSPYMGHIYAGTENFVGEKFMSGIAVYPGDAFNRIAWSETPVHWDVHHRKEFTDAGTHTNLIHHFFGQMDGGVVFVPQGGISQPNHKELSWLPKECVLFHRDKSHSLIRLLGQKYFGDVTKSIKVVFPVHGGDVAHAVRHAHWLNKLCGRDVVWAHTAVVSFDRSTPIGEVTTLKNLLQNCFARVEDFSYARPPIPSYPATANWAFQNIAHRMSKQDHPWLWCEADAVVLKRDWLDRLQLEYDTCGVPFMGVVVPHMGHLQGTAIYPPDAAQRLPSAMTASQQAFDMMTKEHIQGHVHHSKLFCHVWTVSAERTFIPVGGGNLPVGLTAADLQRNVPKEAVFLHRIKDLSVVELLLSDQYVH